jgi:two-component system sensor histidine kinase KdpD
MTARSTIRPDPTPANGPNGHGDGTRSDVWPVRPSERPQPSPVAFAIHDAKNMMGVLSANMEVLRMSLATLPLSGRAVDAVLDIEESVRRLNALLREALSGLQGNRSQPAVPQVLRVAPLVAAVVDRMQSGACARNVRLVQTGPDDTFATIDPALFERVLVNLIENALRFSPPGKSVEVEYFARGGYTTVAVGDRGPGVPEGAREEIFRSYLHRQPEASATHYGLGLAFCREVARAHGGHAWVFNRAHGGACFVFETK